MDDVKPAHTSCGVCPVCNEQVSLCLCFRADQPTLSAPVDEAVHAVVQLEKDRMGAPYWLTEEEFYEQAQETVEVVLNSLSRPKGEEMVLLSKMPRNWELTCGPVDGDLSDEAWQVHSVNGGSNDREWTLLAQADDPAGALRQAIAALGSSSSEPTPSQDQHKEPR